MTQGYLAQESKNANAAARKILFRTFTVFLILIVILILLLKDSLDASDPSGREIYFLLKLCTGIVVLAMAAGLFKTRRGAANGENLILPFEGKTREAVGKIIDQEASEGRIQVEEYIYEIREGKKPNGEKIVLTPSYLLLCGDRTKITAIPRDKIYWICAQVGRKGGPFIVQLQIYTEKKIYNMVGVDIRHVQNIADKLYQYIPNVFSGYDPFILSYELEKLFAKDRAGFLSLYETERRKRADGENPNMASVSNSGF